jgi:NADH dehydrogenase FAD-containing subunit
VPDHPEIYAIGDTACVADPNGKPLPGIAPVAKQQGRYVAQCIMARLRCANAPSPFRYRHFGSLATIGRKSAVADFGRLRLWGTPAWLVWGVVHVLFLLGFRNRVSVLLHWLWAYVTFQSGARLITGSHGQT